MPRELVSLSASKMAHLVNLAASVAAGVGGSMEMLTEEIACTLAPFKTAEDEAWTNRRNDEFASNKAAAQMRHLRAEIAACVQRGASNVKLPSRPDFEGTAFSAWQVSQATQDPEHAKRAALVLIHTPADSQVLALAQILAATEKEPDAYAQTMRMLEMYYKIRAAAVQPLYQIAVAIDRHDYAHRDMQLANLLTQARHTSEAMDSASQLERAAIMAGMADALTSPQCAARQKILALIAEHAPDLKGSMIAQDMTREIEKERRGEALARIQTNGSPLERAEIALFRWKESASRSLAGQSKPLNQSKTWLAYRKERAVKDCEQDINEPRSADRWKAAAQATLTILLADRDGQKAPSLKSLSEATAPAGVAVKDVTESIKWKLGKYGAQYAHGRLNWNPEE